MQHVWMLLMTEPRQLSYWEMGILLLALILFFMILAWNGCLPILPDGAS
jgi:hypothetical protein